MRIDRYAILGIAIIFFAVGTCVAEETETIESQALADSGVKEMQWLWGEVLSVDPAKRQINVKYLDYETDNEKELLLEIDDKTTYENVKDLSEIKPQDILSVDYTVDPNGGNLAANVSVEKLDDSQDPPDFVSPGPVKPDEANQAPAVTPPGLPSSAGQSKQ